MSEKITLEAMSRRRALFMTLVAPLSLAVPSTVLLGSDAKTAQPVGPEAVQPATQKAAQQIAQQTAAPQTAPQTAAPQTAPQTGTERRQKRRTARTERRQERRTARTERRQERRTARTERRTGRAERPKKQSTGGEEKKQQITERASVVCVSPMGDWQFSVGPLHRQRLSCCGLWLWMNRHGRAGARISRRHAVLPPAAAGGRSLFGRARDLRLRARRLPHRRHRR